MCPGVAVGCRISAEEHMQGGLTEEEMIDVARDLEATGRITSALSDSAAGVRARAGISSPLSWTVRSISQAWPGVHGVAENTRHRGLPARSGEDR
jgi:2,4-dienoyl-CoA reductase-like NADH-dependent reductase (Old Yellow Enzyme family)